MTMSASTSLWAVLLHPQGTDLLPFAKSRNGSHNAAHFTTGHGSTNAMTE